MFVSTCGYSQIKTTSSEDVDSLTGVLTKVKIKKIGSGQGNGGSSPRVTKLKITKFNKQGALIYRSRKTKVLRGCLGHTRNWKIVTGHPLGKSNKLKMKGFRNNIIIVKEFHIDGYIKQRMHSYRFNSTNYAWIDNRNTI